MALSRGERIEGLKPPPASVVTGVDNSAGRRRREFGVIGVDFSFEVMLEAAVNERWRSHTVGILESSPLHGKSNDTLVPHG